MNTVDADALVDRLWAELEDMRTGMLGLAHAREAHSQPMTAHFEDVSGPLWFYTRADSEIASATGGDHRAVFHYVGPAHQLYACLHGNLTVSKDRAIIDRFWGEEVARWFPDGPADDAIALLRFDPEDAQIWLPSDGTDKSHVRLNAREKPVDIRAKATL